MPATTQTPEATVSVSRGLVCVWTSVDGRPVCTWQPDVVTEPASPAAGTAA